MATMRTTARETQVFDRSEYRQPSFGGTMTTKALSKVEGQAPPTSVVVAYGLFFVFATGVYHFVAEGEFSSILTMSVMFQCLGFALLVGQVLSKGSAAGISGRSLGLEAIALMLRLSSTTWLNGYLPVDASGDFIYQATDFLSLALVAGLLYQVVMARGNGYQEAEDSLPIVPIIVGAVVLATLLHADMNSRPVFDAAWMAGLFVGAVAVMPQLWMITKTGGKVEALTSHYIAAMAISRVLSGAFMWHARHDITCEPWVEGWEHAIVAVLGAHALNLVLLGDFAYFYVRAVMRQGLGCQLHLEGDLLV